MLVLTLINYYFTQLLIHMDGGLLFDLPVKLSSILGI